jgi:hypothetical protein
MARAFKHADGPSEDGESPPNIMIAALPRLLKK